jgi:peptidoglycan/xylan/chitin deacetylase (PgdA/CDA1 family)
MRAIVKDAFYSCQRQAARLRMRSHPTGDRSRTKFAIFSLHTIAQASSDMAVSEPRLRAQLSGLLEAGYRCLDLSEALRALTSQDPLPQPAFCLTFDDGYRSVYERGLPILEDLDLTATLFVTVNFLDRLVQPPWHSRDAALLREYSVNAAHFQPLDWPQVREMVAGKRVRLGSHSLNHFMIGQLSEADLRAEIRDSKEILENRLGGEVPFFAYPYGVRPYGAYTARSEAIIREAGYRCSCTSRISRAAIGTGAWLLPRLSLVESDTPLDARAKAAGAYDWVAVAQNSFHRIFPNPHSRP